MPEELSLETREAQEAYFGKVEGMRKDYESLERPSPRSFGIGDDVVVTYPDSRYFKRIGTVTDLNYLESSARKGYSDYMVTVEFPDGQSRRFLCGRVRPVEYLTETTEVFLDRRAEGYARARERRKLREVRR